MGYIPQSLFARVEEETSEEPDPVLTLDEVMGEAPDMVPTWAEGSRTFHTKARCSRLQAIAQENLRRNVSPPREYMLCEFCRLITLRGRKG